MSDTLGWPAQKVRHLDGRTGKITGEYIGFLHASLKICQADGGEAFVQLNTNGPDTGDAGWSWLCRNFTGGPMWLPLGDHWGGEMVPAEDAPEGEQS